MPKGRTSTGKGEKNMPKGRNYTSEEATQKVLDMSTDMDTEQSDHNTSNESSVDSEPEEYMDTVLRRDAVKRVYDQKRGHTDSSVADKDKMSDNSFEFQDDELQMSPPHTAKSSLLAQMYAQQKSNSQHVSGNATHAMYQHADGVGGRHGQLTIVSRPRYIFDTHTHLMLQ